jgi:poly(3-hydroxyalkanoate) synthetase
MRFLGIEEYRAGLNVLVDRVGGLVDLIGLCQGGWLSLVYAGRFPNKVRKLVMPARRCLPRQSPLSALAQRLLIMFESLLISGMVALSAAMSRSSGNGTDAIDIRDLADASADRLAGIRAARSRLQNWNSWTIDVPGKYYLEIIEKLYKRNELASGSLVALGQKIDSRLRLPMYLLPGTPTMWLRRNNCLQWSSWQERRRRISPRVAPCNHLALFMGRRALEEYWPRIVRWMKSIE